MLPWRGVMCVNYIHTFELLIIVVLPIFLSTESDQFMMVYASNQPSQFDEAVLDRIDEMVEFELCVILVKPLIFCS